MGYALSTTLHTSFEDAVERTRKALADQGFGVLTEIDMKATLKAKLGEDMEDYLILGACNPPLAHRAVNADRQIGLLLPCNVAVRADTTAGGDAVIIDAMDPQVMVQLSDQPGLREVANEATAKLQAAIDSLPVRRRAIRPAGASRPSALKHCDRCRSHSFSALHRRAVGVARWRRVDPGRSRAGLRHGPGVEQAIPISLIVVGVAAAFGAVPKVRASHVHGGWPRSSPRSASRHLRRIGHWSPSARCGDHDRLRGGDGHGR